MLVIREYSVLAKKAFCVGKESILRWQKRFCEVVTKVLTLR